jgi:hypothetical protein
MADVIFDRCTVHGVKLSFTSRAQLGAHPQNRLFMTHFPHEAVVRKLGEAI